jgi:hypothetical protein
MRRLVFLTSITGLILLAGAPKIVCWLDECGIIAFATHVRLEYLTGTAITIIVALLLFGSDGAYRFYRCRVCKRMLLRRGTYCPDCGSRL